MKLRLLAFPGIVEDRDPDPELNGDLAVDKRPGFLGCHILWLPLFCNCMYVRSRTI